MNIWDKDGGKNTLEWQMFVDMFAIVKKYWKPQESQAEEYLAEVNRWYDKYNGDNLIAKNPGGTKESIDRAKTLGIWSKCILQMLCDAFDMLTKVEK